MSAWPATLRLELIRARGLVLAVAALLLLGSCLFAADESRSARVFVSFEGASPATVSPGKPAEVELNFRVKEGFHVNSNKPNSELLIPTTLKLEPPTDLSAGAILFPPGKDISFPFDPSEKLNVYSDAFMVKAKLMAASTASSGNLTVHGQLRYQACNDNACFPPKNIPFQFDVRVVGAANKRHGSSAPTPPIR
jgi:Disulphide bond corrector protein DsbC